MLFVKTLTAHEKPIAQAGLIAAGLVYCLLGILIFMAAFRINGRRAANTDAEGVLDLVYKQTGGQIMLGIIALGLICYSLWRGVQAFADSEHQGRNVKGFATRAGFFFSGLVYESLAVVAINLVFSNTSADDASLEDVAHGLLSRPFGQWLTGIGAAILLAIGIYQIWFGLSEQHHQLAQKAGQSKHTKLLLSAGKIGFVARGIVWIVLAWFFFNAAIHANSAEAGDTSEALHFVRNVAYGTYLLAAIGFGFFCFGAFNFIRARYERFG